MLNTLIVICHFLMAMKCEYDYKIPASVQLAQSMLESGYGRSYIGKNSYNCFGIKAYSNWHGKTFTARDNSVYRKYDSYFDSYVDHAKFMQHHYKGAVGKNWRYWVANCKGYGGSNQYWKMIEQYIIKYKLDKFDLL